MRAINPGVGATGIRPAQPAAGIRPAQPPAGIRPAQPPAGIRSAQPPAGIRPAQPEAARQPKATLDQGDFLRLLTAQLQNQDPTKPVDNFQYVQQMATFTQVSGTTETNVKLTAVIERLDQLIAKSAALAPAPGTTSPETTNPASN